MPEPQPIKGIFFRDIKNDYVGHIVKEIYFDNIYHPYFQNKKDLQILDIGANVGIFTFYASEFAGHLWAVEPSQQHFETLTKNVVFNRLTNVTALKVAVSNKDGDAALYHNENTTMFSLKGEVNSLPGEAEKVETVRLDTLFEKQKIDHIDFLKLDCEGAEVEIICGDGFEKVADKIDLIVGEYHSWTRTNPKQFELAFRDNGFDFRWVSATEASIFEAKRIKEADESI